MTRWARGKPSKLPHDSSSWKDLKGDVKTTSPDKARKPGSKQQRPSQNFQGKKGKFKARSDQEIELMKKLRQLKRGDEKRLKRIKERASKIVCFNCREPGHKVGDCPQIKEDPSQGTGICFKCGSTEHISHTCTAKVQPGKYPYATCFVCKKQGHLSRDCPQNDHGLYPNGGCCLECGSVKHFKKDCPEALKKQGLGEVKLPVLDAEHSADADMELMEESQPVVPHKKPKKKKKVVKF